MATAVCGRLASDRKHTKGDGRRPGSMAQSPRYNVSSVATRIFRAVGTALTRSPPQIHALCTIYFTKGGDCWVPTRNGSFSSSCRVGDESRPVIAPSNSSVRVLRMSGLISRRYVSIDRFMAETSPPARMRMNPSSFNRSTVFSYVGRLLLRTFWKIDMWKPLVGRHVVYCSTIFSTSMWVSRGCY